MQSLKNKVLNCLWVTKDVDIGLLRSATIHVVILEVIIVVILVEVNLGHKRPATIPLTIVYQYIVLKGEVYICLRPVTINHITQVTVVDY